MRALTLHAPWAWAICYLGKDIENRSWQPPATIIGERIAIHAGGPAQWDAMYRKFRWAPVFVCANRAPLLDGAQDKVRATFKSGDVAYKAERDRFCSSIVATAVISKVLPPQDIDAGWYIAGNYGWKLTDVQVLSQPVPIARGMLGFWNLTPEQEAAVVAAGRLQ